MEFEGNELRTEDYMEQSKDYLFRFPQENMEVKSEECHILPPQIQCFGCRICGCEFADQDSLNMHVHRQHYHRPKQSMYHQNKYNYVCAICKKQSVTQLGMIKHLNDEHLIIKESQPIALKPYWDSYFGSYKRIIMKGNYRRKQKLPQKIMLNKNRRKSKFLVQLKIKWAKKLWIQLLNCRKLNCTLCYKQSGEYRAYNTKSALELHQLRKHPKKPFQCTACARSFQFLYQLQLHRNAEHSS